MPRRKKQPETKRLTEQQIVTFGQIFPGFDVWYREAYDEQGNLKPEHRMSGLRPRQEEKGIADEH